jgi:CheY-like chemotaxis protein
MWIEDSARLELANLVGPVYFTGRYDFTLAEDVTTAVHMLLAQEFDVLIVDVRLPPGSDPIWKKLYQRSGEDKVSAQLGLKLLYWLLGRNPSLYASQPPGWATPYRISVFTVESRREIQDDLSQLGITAYKQKVADLPDTVLIDLIEQHMARLRTIH